MPTMRSLMPTSPSTIVLGAPTDPKPGARLAGTHQGERRWRGPFWLSTYSESQGFEHVGKQRKPLLRPTDVLINIIDVTAIDPGAESAYYKPVTLPLTVDRAGAVRQERYDLEVWNPRAKIACLRRIGPEGCEPVASSRGPQESSKS